jgi:carbon storage regulator CsrA
LAIGRIFFGYNTNRPKLKLACLSEKKGVFMLVLTRKTDESITIKCPDGKIIKVAVCRIDGNFKVRLGIEAGDEYKITRTELIKKSNLTEEEFFSKF